MLIFFIYFWLPVCVGERANLCRLKQCMSKCACVFQLVNICACVFHVCV